MVSLLHGAPRMRRIGLPASRLALALALALALPACAPPDDSDAVTSIGEVEPNDTDKDATAMGGEGYYTFFGLCDAGESADWFQVNAGDGRLSGEVYATTDVPGVSSFAAAELRFSVRGEELGKLDEASIADGQRGGFSADVSAPQVVFLEVACPGDVPWWFQGSVRVP